MALADWRWIVTDTEAAPAGELTNADDRRLSLALSKIDTASFSVRGDHPMADLLIGLEGFLKIYRNDVLLFHGPMVDAEEDIGEEGRIRVNAAGPAWALDRRYGQLSPPSLQIASGTDRALAAWSLIEVMNRQYYTVGMYGGGSYAAEVTTFPQFRETGHTLIDGVNSSYSITAASTLGATYDVPPFKPFLEILAELAAGVNGFEWRFMPKGNWPVTSFPKQHIISNFWAAPTIGTTRPEAVFELGTGRQSIKSGTRTMSRATQANSVRHLLSQSDSNTVRGVNNAQTAKWGVMEDIVQADLTNTTMRQQLVDEHAAVRHTPRHTIVFEPTPDYGNGRLPRYGIDYDVGDIVTGRAVSLGRTRFDAQFRVWAVEFILDKFGVETPKLTLDEQGA